MPISAQEWRARTGVNNAGRVCRPVSSGASSGKWEGVTVGRGVCVPGPLLYKACTLVLLMLLLLAGISDHEPGGQKIVEPSSVPGLESEVCVSVLRVVPVLCMAYSLVVRMLLLLSGDVERNPGPETIISLDDFSELLEILVPVSGDWEVLLVALGVTGAKRDMIKAQRAHNPKLCLLDGLEDWIRTNDSPTFEKIIKALSSKLVGWNGLAEEVEMFANLRQKTESTEVTTLKSPRERHEDEDDTGSAEACDHPPAYQLHQLLSEGAHPPPMKYIMRVVTMQTHVTEWRVSCAILKYMRSFRKLDSDNPFITTATFYTSFRFMEDIVKLDLPAKGITVEDGNWKIQPLVPPQFFRPDVEDDDLSKVFPGCSIAIEWVGSGKPSTTLRHVVKISGTTDKDNFFLIRVNPVESRLRFKAAMETGSIKIRISTVLFHGPAGSGKTCSKALIVGEEPPAVRQSTPVAARPTRIFRFDISDDEWKPFSPQQRKNFLAQAAKSQAVSKPASESKKLSFPIRVRTSQKSSVSDHHPSESDVNPDSGLEDPVISELTTDKELVELMRKCSPSETVLKLHMMHVIDTGGQPQCHDLMRCFVKQRTSLYTFVFKLSDELNTKPLIAYYDENGHLLSADVRATQTNEQILQQCIRTIQSQKSKMLFLGTHMDQEGQCAETRCSKNEKLLRMVLPLFEKEVVYYNLSASPKELIFPINARDPSQHEKDIAKNVRQLISTKCFSEEFDLPMQWYGLEIILEELSECTGRKIMHRSECLEASKKLHFDELSFDAAIDYLDEHCLIFHYRDILPNVIFSDVQVLLDKVTELVQASYQVKSGITRAHEGYWQSFCDCARVSQAFLSQDLFKKHYVDDLFTPTQLIALFRRLSIFADFNEKEYFVPALLESLSNDELKSHRVSASAALPPLVLVFPDGGPQLGVFCCLIVFLLSSENSFPVPWKLQCNSDQVTPKCLKRNCVVFRIPGYAGSISVIDSYHHLELHFTFPPRIAAKPSSLYAKISSLICQAVVKGLMVASQKLDYDFVMPNPCFACPCTRAVFHHAKPGNGNTCLICSEDEEECCELQPSHNVWLESFSQACQRLADVKMDCDSCTTPVTESCDAGVLVELLSEEAGRWELFLGQLGVSEGVRGQIKLEHAGKPEFAKLCLQSGLESWVKSDPRPTYQMLSAVLRGSTVTNSPLALAVERLAAQHI